MPAGDFVDRVMDIIELLADESMGLPVSDIARRLDMPKSAAHRLLSSLVNRGFALQDDTSQRYRLSVKLAAVGFRVLAGAGTSDICQPSLDRLATRTGELVRLALVEGDTLFWIAKSQCHSDWQGVAVDNEQRSRSQPREEARICGAGTLRQTRCSR
jgi:IclR family acetate operon transcriptional repressor